MADPKAFASEIKAGLFPDMALTGSQGVAGRKEYTRTESDLTTAFSADNKSGAYFAIGTPYGPGRRDAVFGYLKDGTHVRAESIGGDKARIFVDGAEVKGDKIDPTHLDGLSKVGDAAQKAGIINAPVALPAANAAGKTTNTRACPPKPLSCNM